MMEIIENILPQQISSSLGWMLFHSIWQGILISCLVMLLLKLVPRDDPNVKHNVIALGLGVLLFSSVITFVHIYFSHGVQSGPAAIYLTGLSQSFSQAITDKTSGISIGYWINRNVHLISISWIFGVVLASIRIIGGIAYIKIALRKSGSIFPKTWITTLSRLKTNLQIDKRVALGTTDLISSPVMTGFLRPMILFPVAVVNHLSPGEAEAIIAHELAHIKRNDYLLNLLYCLIEVIYFFNPAAWWMLQKVRAERENSCDDLAISLGIDRLQYARALIKIQELKTHYQIALSFGGRSSSLLMTRIQRVLNGRFSSGRQHQSLLYIFLLLFSAMFVMSVRFSDQELNQSEAQLPETGWIQFVDSLPDLEIFDADSEETFEAPKKSIVSHSGKLDKSKENNPNKSDELQPRSSEVPEPIDHQIPLLEYEFSENTGDHLKKIGQDFSQMDNLNRSMHDGLKSLDQLFTQMTKAQSSLIQLDSIMASVFSQPGSLDLNISGFFREFDHLSSPQSGFPLGIELPVEVDRKRNLNRRRVENLREQARQKFDFRMNFVFDDPRHISKVKDDVSHNFIIRIGNENKSIIISTK